MIWDYFFKGGIIMYPLLIFSIIALGLILERFFYYRRLKIDIHAWFSYFSDSLFSEEKKKGSRFEGLKKHPLRKVLRSLWRDRIMLRTDLEAIAKEEAEEELQNLEKNLKPLGVIAILSPLLGLLGTVWGIMKAFHQTAGATKVEPTLLAAGIWEALITTFVGLAIAIPTWLAYYYFESKVNQTAFQMEFFSSRFLRTLEQIPTFKEENNEKKKEWDLKKWA